jgi:UDP-glucose 4-epimerase
MRIGITGGAGFIGGNLVAHLVRDGHEAVLVDDLSTGSRANVVDDPSVRLHEGTILDSELLDTAFAGCDAIVHLAARPSVPRSIQDPLATHAANATGTLMVLEAARRLDNPHVVLASSSSVYGANPVLPKHEELRTAPISPYAVSKQATEAYAAAYQACYGLPTLAFRFFNVFGPLQAPDHDYAAVLPKFIAAALAGEALPVYGDGHQTRDFTYVGSVVAVIADALQRRVTSPGPVNLAFGSRRSLLDVIAMLEELLGRPLTVDHHDPRPGDIRDSQADRSRLEQLFPKVAPTDFAEGLRLTVDWLRERSAA